jgi:hypothetical protein
VPLLAALICALPLLVASCGGAAAEPGAAPGIARDTRNISFDPTPLYRQMGLIARGLPFPITGRVGYFASPTPARTHVALTLSFASASLTFAREADNRFRANYTVSLALDNVTGRVHAVESTEAVVVSSFRETSRTDESVLFQQFVDLAPGRGEFRRQLVIGLPVRPALHPLLVKVFDFAHDDNSFARCKASSISRFGVFCVFLTNTRTTTTRRSVAVT